MTEYTPDQQKVAEYISELTQGQIGGGDDPVGFLIASHAVLSEEFITLRKQSFTEYELDLFRQWFDYIDTHSADYMTEDDRQLKVKLLTMLLADVQDEEKDIEEAEAEITEAIESALLAAAPESQKPESPEGS